MMTMKNESWCHFLRPTVLGSPSSVGLFFCGSTRGGTIHSIRFAMTHNKSTGRTVKVSN
jgi:hypothetical protein